MHARTLLPIYHPSASNKYATTILLCLSSLWSVSLLPQRIICQDCGYVLYNGAELKPPDEILHQYNGKCPKCGRKLSLVPVNVDVIPIR